MNIAGPLSFRPSAFFTQAPQVVSARPAPAETLAEEATCTDCAPAADASFDQVSHAARTYAHAHAISAHVDNFLTATPDL